jgi:hypothetical protein
MKDLMKHLSCLLILLLAGMALPSCGDDDDEPDGSSSAFVGTWEESYEYDGYTYTDRATFYSNGTGKVIANYATTDPREESFTETFNWSYDESTRILTLTGTNSEDDDWASYYVEEVNSTRAVVYEYYNGYTDDWQIVWTRVK